MILRIVVPLVASVGAAATLKLDLCVSPMGRWRGDTEGERGQTGDEVHGADAVFVVGFERKY